MSATSPPVKRRFAPLKNVASCHALVERLRARPDGLPGIGVFYSPSGYGKSWSSIYAQNKTRAVRVEVGESWNRKSFIEALLQELGQSRPKGTIATLMSEAIGLLGDDPFRPLFIDEADKLVDKHMIELVREIHEHSQVPVLLIGEEMLPKKLERIERVHNRVLEWLPALECDIEDARKLASVYLDKVKIDDATLERVRSVADGRARRIAVTLTAMSEWARASGAKEIDERYTGQFHNGRTPTLRRVRAA